ncbi:MAG: family 10 glycosylhydrolase, partial [Gemmatimonadaceae bacterium]
DPGIPAARDYVLATMLDVVKRYDVDGIHIDDYFYPYREVNTITRRVHGKRVRQTREIPFPDDKSWVKYGKAKGWTDRDAWRRANIDDFIHALYTGTKALKPATLVGISPFGIWRSGTPRGITGLDAYGELYADSKRWLSEGWLDYLVPQLYWQVGGTEDRFRALDAWWRSENPRGRYIWPGLYDAHIYGGRDPWPVGEIRNQLAFIRDSRAGTGDPSGEVHFRLSALFAEHDLVGATLADAYGRLALVPAFPWLGGTAPASPQVSIVSKDGAIVFSITPGDTVDVRWWLIQTRGRAGVWASSLRPAGDGRLAASAFGTVDPDEIAVTAVGATGMASAPTVVGANTELLR